MGNVLCFVHATASTGGYKSGRNSDLEMPVAASTGSTNSAGMPRLERFSQYQTWDCVVPMRSASGFWPPASTHARRRASVDMRERYSVLGKRQPRNLWKTAYLDFGTFVRMGEAEKEAFGRRVRERREELGWSQPELSQRSGISQQHISHIERGLLKEPERRAGRLAKALETTEEWLLQGEGPKGILPPIMSPGEVVDDYGALDEIGRREVSKLLRSLHATRKRPK